MKKRLKINGVIIFLAVLAVAFFPRIFFRFGFEYPLNESAEIFGIALILLGQILRTSARGYKFEHSQAGVSLVTGGPYSLVRNPMYLGIFLIGLGIVFMLFQWWAALIFAVVFISRYIFLIFKEEKRLLSLFGRDYENYCRRVPCRIFPLLSTLLNIDMHEYLPLKFSWVKRETGSILAVLLGTILFESWKDISVEGLGLYLKEAAGVFVVIVLFMGLAFYLSQRHEVDREDDSGKNWTNLQQKD